MADNPRNVAQLWYKAYLNDAGLESTIRSAHSALVAASLSPGGLHTVTNASKNAVSMGKSMGLSISQTLSALTLTIESIEAGFWMGSSRTKAYF